MKYRLALKLDLEKKPYAGGGNMAIGWSVLKLKENQTQYGAGVESLKKELGRASADVSVFLYQNPEDMLDPMSLQEQELRLSEAMAQLPRGCKVNKVWFNRDEYQKYLAEKKLNDSHETRANWLLQITC